jgi:Domain of Unknown Function (DUF748)
MKNQTNKSFWKMRILPISFFLVVLLIGIRLVLEPLLLNFANKQAITINPVFDGHIGDLDLSLLKGGVLIEDFTAKIKNNGREFFRVKEIIVDVAWKKLIRGEVMFDILIDNFQLNFEKDLISSLKKLPDKQEKMELPITISRLDFQNSRVVLNEYPGLNDQKALTLNDIHGTITNISGKEESPLGKYEISAGLSKKDDLKLNGNFDFSNEKPRWDMNLRIQKFDLSSGNEALSHLVPMNFKKGTFDLYLEAKSEKGKVFGYLKPFFNDVEFMGNNRDFKGARHFFVEVAGAVTDFVFQHSEKKSVATRVPFIFKDGAFSVEGGGAITDAIQHGILENETVPRGIEQKYRLNNPNPEEVQAQEDDLKKAKEKRKMNN